MDVLFSLLGFGFLLGIRHAFDADHVAAVSTIATKNKSVKKSSLVGMFWGIGHALSLLIVGLIILLLKTAIPEKLALFFELIVGIMLVALGMNTILTINKNKVHFHKHRHGQEEHIHFHSHKIRNNHCHEHLHFHQSLFVGIIHGLAGSAALSLLVLTSIKSIWTGMTYILVFGIGSVTGMMLISSIISLPFALISKKFERAQRILRLSAGLISTTTGLIIMI